MRTVRFPLLRGSIFLIALAAMAFILARGDTHTAQAHSFEPFEAVTISDTAAGASADIKIDFALNEPEPYPNLTKHPAIQFLPRQWGIHVPETEEEMLAHVGGLSGTFDAVTDVGVLGGPCTAPTLVNFTMMDSTPDTGYDPATGAYDPQKLASSLDLGKGKGPGGTDIHPMGAGFSGQFVDDPNFTEYPPDYGRALIRFNADEKYLGYSYGKQSNIYRDVDGSGSITAGDIRLHLGPDFAAANPSLGPGTIVQTGDADQAVDYWQKKLSIFSRWAQQKHDETVAANGVMDPGEEVYNDTDGSGAVSAMDLRLFEFQGEQYASAVKTYALPGGVTRYPDFLNLMFPPDAVGNPLARQFGRSRVLWNPVSVNLVTFRPGQLPGYPASLGYPTVVVILNPLELGADPAFVATASDMCSPLTLTSQNFGVSKDNPDTPARNEGGFVRLTNPKAERDETFTLVVEAQPDADDDGIENLLDSCPLDANLENDQRSYSAVDIPDNDGIDSACDPMQTPPADWGASLVPFNADEKSNMSARFGDGASNALYRDNDGDGKVSLGDDRLSNYMGPGDADYTPAGVVGSPPPSDFGTALIAFNANEFHNRTGAFNPTSLFTQTIYRDMDGSGNVSVGDLRLTQWRVPSVSQYRAAGTTVAAGDQELSTALRVFTPMAANEKHADADGNGQMDPGEGVYVDKDGSGDVSWSDVRQFTFEGKAPPSVVRDPDMGQMLYTPLAGAGSLMPMKHTENVAANGRYDPGENAYWDGDGDGRVGSSVDGNQFDVDGRALFEGTLVSSWVQYIGASAPGPDTGVQDEDQDNYFDLGDNCATVANGVQVTNIERVQLRLIEFDLVSRGGLIGPDEQKDTDGDGIGDACEGAEHGAQCLNDLDDDGDGSVNDGCPRDHPDDSGRAAYTENFGYGESVVSGGDFGWCQDAADNDGDGAVNDGCPRFPQKWSNAEAGPQCANDLDDDGDGRVNDGCPPARTAGAGAAETGAQCDNALDDDGDGLVNDGCPAADPGNMAKTTVTGHVHTLSIERTVTITGKHGIKLTNLGGPGTIKDNGARTYTVDVSNLSGSDPENIQVALQVVEGCATVNGVAGENTAVVPLAPGESGSAGFTVDFTGCPAGEYTVQADACHGGDPAPAGFFGQGKCPGYAAHGELITGVVPLVAATASSEALAAGQTYVAANAIDGTNSEWCNNYDDPAPWVQVETASPSDINGVDISHQAQYYPGFFSSGTITMSNGFSMDVTLSVTGDSSQPQGEGSFTFPAQTGIEWVRFTGVPAAGAGQLGCLSEIILNGSWMTPPPDPNPLDDAPIAESVVVGTP